MIEILSGEAEGIQHAVLPAKLTLSEADELGKLLLDMFSKKQSVIVDFKNVQEIRTPVIQVVLSAFEYFKENDLQLNFVNVGQCVEESLSILGLNADLAKMESN